MKQNKITWREKYILSLEEYLNCKEIGILFGVSHQYAADIKSKAKKYCIINNLNIVGNKIPIEAIFKVTGKDIDYFYQKMVLESKVV